MFWLKELKLACLSVGRPLHQMNVGLQLIQQLHDSALGTIFSATTFDTGGSLLLNC
jgi:hypothetical protein